MAYNNIGGMPPQQLSFSRKNKLWRKKNVDVADSYSLMHNHGARKNWFNMQVNYDLMNGKLHMSDVTALVNPYHIEASFIPDSIQHYPIINSKLNVLRGEESERLFDPRVIVTNPSAISMMEEERNNQINQKLQQLIMDSSQSEEDFQRELQRLDGYFRYEYQDKREIRGNLFINHYMRELEMEQQFNLGFEDAKIVGEEIYQCDIVGGEPTLERVDPMSIKIIRSGYSNRIEDADLIVIEEYKNLGWIHDRYWDVLTKKDYEVLERGSVGDSDTDPMDSIDSRRGNPIIPMPNDWTAGDKIISPNDLFDDNNYLNNLAPYDTNGNVRVLRVYWKSRRKIKKVKSYDPETGEEQFDFYPETYHCDPMKGEEEQVFWVNEAWEGTKLADSIYVNMRPRPVQYNRLSDPSRCHFGIVGSIYALSGTEPYSMVDMMKPYAYLYDVVHDRLNKTLAKNVGKVIRMDFAKVPKGWDVDKWLYFININGVAVENSWNEGDIGAATGRLAASLNNASNGVIDASLGTEIQQYIALLEWVDSMTGKMVGITDQRLGQISNRETVGGVERATLQSSHITKWWFFIHDSVKRRALECFLETAKIAYKGRKIKFNYILSDGSRQLVELDGDEFAECDYGLAVISDNDVQELNQQLGSLAQAALQNDKMNFSTLMRIYTTKSLAEKQRLIEQYEQQVMEQQQQTQQQQVQLQQQQLQQQAQIEQAKMERDYQMHAEDNQTKILVAQINSRAEELRMSIMNNDNAEANQIEREKIAEEARQFDKQIAFNKEKLKEDTAVKRLQINQKKEK